MISSQMCSTRTIKDMLASFAQTQLIEKRGKDVVNIPKSIRSAPFGMHSGWSTSRDNQSERFFNISFLYL